MKLTDKQREKVKEYLFNVYMTGMFGDGMEEEYIKGGFPAFKGINHMTDDELLEEAGFEGNQKDIPGFLKDPWNY